MGASMSSPIDEEKMKAVIEETLKTFGEKYPKAYTSALMKKVVEDARKDAASDYKLLSRPKDQASKDPIKTGWMTKEGAVVKNWKKRFFVLRWDYKIEYYDKEEAFKSGGNPKGTINPSGYKVAENPESELQKRIDELAAKLKMEPSALPKAKSLPANTVGLLRKGRRDWFIQFDSEAQKAEWVPLLATACKKAEGLNSQDAVTRNAYKAAFAATCRARGYKASSFDGSEEQNLTDLIVKQLEKSVLGEVFSKIESEVPAGKMRVMAGDKIDSVLSTSVGAAVGAGWATIARASEATRPAVESKLEPEADKIVAAQDKIRQKICGIVSPSVDSAVAKVAAPTADVVLEVVMEPVKAAYKFLEGVFAKHLEDSTTKITAGGDDQPIWKELAKIPSAAATFAEVTAGFKSFHKLLEKAEKLGEIKAEADDIDTMIANASTAIKDLLDRAFYTLQTLFAQLTKDGKDKATAIKDAGADTTGRLQHDVGVSMLELGRNLIGTFVNPFVKKDVLEPAKEKLAPVDEEVPELLKDIINLEEDLEATVDQIVNDAIDALVRPAIQA